MPVPSHLFDSVSPKDSVIDESALDAEVICSCGSRQFELQYPGQTHEYRGEQTPCTALVGGQFFFVIKARCSACGHEHLLFDKDFHGWDGFVCHDETQASEPRPPLTPWHCVTCGKSQHEASVQIHAQGREDFVAETDGEIDEARWPDAFDCFGMSITCIGCGNGCHTRRCRHRSVGAVPVLLWTRHRIATTTQVAVCPSYQRLNQHMPRRDRREDVHDGGEPLRWFCDDSPLDGRGYIGLYFWYENGHFHPRRRL